MYFDNPDATKYTCIKDPTEGFNVPWLPMPVYPNGAGSKDVRLCGGAWAKLQAPNPSVAGFEVLAGQGRRPADLMVRIFGLGSGEARIEARTTMSRRIEAAVLVSVFPLLFPRVNVWFAADNPPSAANQDPAKLIRGLNELATPFTGIEFRLGRVDKINLGVDVTSGAALAKPDPVNEREINARLRAIPRELGTVGQLNVILVRQFTPTALAVGYSPDQPGDVVIVGEHVKPPQTIASTVLHELGHCLGFPGDHMNEADPVRLLYWAPRGTVIHREAALIMRAGARGR